MSCQRTARIAEISRKVTAGYLFYVKTVQCCRSLTVRIQLLSVDFWGSPDTAYIDWAGARKVVLESETNSQQVLHMTSDPATHTHAHRTVSIDNEISDVVCGNLNQINASKETRLKHTKY